MRLTVNCRVVLWACGVMQAALLSAAWAADIVRVPPWQKPYLGDEASAASVVTLWSFDGETPTEDASGNGHTLELRGTSRVVKGGRFGSCLECFASTIDSRQGAMTAKHPALSPSGAFTLELWLKPKPALADRTLAFLLDNKYFHYQKALPQAHSGYCLILAKARSQWRPRVMLGYGTESEYYDASPIDLRAGQWYHLAFTYDGAGTGQFHLDGTLIGRQTHEGRGSVAPAKYALAIGDRHGSNYAPFPGYIDQVRISRGVIPFYSGRLAVDVDDVRARTSFRRMEKDAHVRVVIRNETGEALTGVAHVTLLGAKQMVRLPAVAAGQAKTVDVPVDTTLRPGTYNVRCAVSATLGREKLAVEEAFTVTIAPRPLAHTMPVVLWGDPDEDLATFREIGFTHHFFHLNYADQYAVWKAGRPVDTLSDQTTSTVGKMLNRYLAEGIGLAVYLYPGRYAIRDKRLGADYRRIDRAGKPYKRRNVCALFPEVQTFSYNVGASVARAFGHFPALEASLIHSEVRDTTNLCFHAHDKDAFQRYAGRPVPEEAVAKRLDPRRQLPHLPKNRIVPDDHPLLTYYRWFWRQGDGWNKLHTLVTRGLKSTGRDDLWTWFDPAVRAPSIWGSGGEVDVISQWTYTYPDPIKMGQATDELFAMANGRRDMKPRAQQVMKMTQMIWYRGPCAPKRAEGARGRQVQWEKDFPKASYITIAPDHLRIAFWSMIARPVRGIMYFAWGALVPLKKPKPQSGCTNRATRATLTELTRDVVRPLGPTLLQVPDPPHTDVAVLQSFTSQLFANVGTWGWSNGWSADAYLILQWAHIQARIVYEETILRDGLDGVRVLVMPDCHVLTRSVARRIVAFQNAGGIIVGDEQLAPAITPDILLERYRRSGRGDKDKAALQARAAVLRRELDSVYRRYVDASHPDVVVRFRRYATTDYLFAVNDNRTFGDYVGHHGLVMEKGVPTTARLSVRRSTGHVYDLVAHKPIPTTPTPEGLAFEATFRPGGGRLFMVVEQRIADVGIAAPTEAQRGKPIAVTVSVLDATKRTVAAVVPVRLDILDPRGRPAEFSGYYGAKDGRLSVTLDLAPNDLPGMWTIRARELASGLSRRHEFSVKP